ncbi:hypothetical protein AVEN_48341-1 [Araneus ventricosus]|uniref:Uncharacterized protein n=1 Tax=Araneus ventricosus TaxID=182803 RepID=A0A4Y1ZSM7_ARAVE|nr:hypothetical protein AVEN_48341-1 [Araneus ventricosus]
MTRTRPELAPLLSFNTTPALGRLAPTCDLGCTRLTCAADVWCNRVSNSESSILKEATLSQGHRGPLYSYTECQFSVPRGYLVGPVSIPLI